MTQKKDKNLTCAQKKNFILQEIAKIYFSYSHLSRTDRILSYINHFCQNFHYDKNAREEYLHVTHFSETFEENENALYELFTKKKGVCMQFAQALSLLAAFDNSISNDMPSIVYAAGLIQTKSQPKLGHALNLIFSRKKQPIVIDITSMLHAQEGEFKQNKTSFGMIYMDEYLQNLAKEGINFLPTESGLSLQCYRSDKLPPTDLCDLLNTPLDKMTAKDKKNIFYFNLPNEKK